MLICLVLCAAAVLPTTFSQRFQPEPLYQYEPQANLRYYLLDQRQPYKPRLYNPLQEEEHGFQRPVRFGRDFDPLLGRSFGNNKRNLQVQGYASIFPRNSNSGEDKQQPKIEPKSQEHDLSVRDAGEKEDKHSSEETEKDSKETKLSEKSIYQSNFDDTDNGFDDYLYRNPFDGSYNPRFNNYGYKRNFDEIDNAGFDDHLYKRRFGGSRGLNPYLYKRNFDEIDNAGFKDYLYKRMQTNCTPKGCFYRKKDDGKPPK